MKTIKLIFFEKNIAESLDQDRIPKMWQTHTLKMRFCWGDMDITRDDNECVKAL